MTEKPMTEEECGVSIIHQERETISVHIDCKNRIAILEQELSSLRAENERLKQGRVLCKSCQKDTASAESAQCYNCRNRPYDENEKLKERLEKYGRHSDFCGKFTTECTCGLSKLLEGGK